jgi:SOS response regulatory protein OraA/RecX
VDGRSADWNLRAQALRRRRFGPTVPTAGVERARQARFLLHRGFTGAQVRAALGRAAGDSFEDLQAEAGATARFETEQDDPH